MISFKAIRARAEKRKGGAVRKHPIVFYLAKTAAVDGVRGLGGCP